MAAILMASVLAAPILTAEDVGKGSVTLDRSWQFHTGDDPSWASPAFDDSGWETLSADKSWGLQTHFNYDGYAWYRRHLSLTPAPGALLALDLLVPAVDGAYEVYWNGARVGQCGSLPPHLLVYGKVEPQIYNLGPIRSGVLAFRFFQPPPESNDRGTAGGFAAAPSVGSPEAIANLKAALDFKWLRGMQFRFALSSLYGLVALLGLFAWSRDRTQSILFWTSIYAAMLFVETPVDFLRLHVAASILALLRLVATGTREISLWFLLIWLLRIDDEPRLARTLRGIAIFTLTLVTCDALLFPLYPAWLNARSFEIADAILTAIYMPPGLVVVFIVGIAIYRKRRLDSARWAVAILAFCNTIFYFVLNVTSQGNRFTGWDFPDAMDAPVFALYGSPLNMRLILRTLLFFLIVWAVVRYALEKFRQQGALELEMRSARELQQVLIPEDSPQLRGYTLASAYRPASEVGGDFFQIIVVEADATLIVLGDVSGKGLKAAMAVSLIVGTIRTLAESTSKPAMILAGLNRRLHGRLHGGFATCMAMHLSPGGACVLANAGQIPPYWNGKEMICEAGLPLGIVANAEYSETHVDLTPGDTLTMLSDGVLEARNASGELYGFDRTAAISTQSAEAIAQAAQAFGQEDDITVLTLNFAEIAEPG